MNHQLSRDEAFEKIEELETRLDEFGVVMNGWKTCLEDLQEENQELRDRVARLEARVEPDPAGKEYDEKSRSEKNHEVRVAVARKAAGNGGKAQFDYNEVLALFDQHLSRGHAYTLMELAANADGFDYGEFQPGKRLRVDLGAVNDERVLHAVNTSGKGDADE